ncbi:MAG: hypothetical protein PGN21_08360 [Sphingomonas paucimobilis]
MIDDQDASRRFVTAALRRQSEERDKGKAHSRRGKECPIQRPMFDAWPKSKV